MGQVYDRLDGTTRSQFLITPASFVGPPTTDFHQKGEAHVDSSGDWWFCITSGTPGTWVKGLDLSTGVSGNPAFTTMACRNNNNATDLWLRGADRLPMNQSPLRLPFDARLTHISGTTNGNETFDFEVYKNADVRAGGIPSDANKIAELQFVAQQAGDIDLTGSPVDLVQGDEIGVYMRGTNVNRPRVDLFFTRRFP